MKRASSLLSSYLTTEYRVLGVTRAQRFTLRVGMRQPRLAELQYRTRTYRSAFITAWNPRSVTHAPSFNEAMQQRLVRDLRRLKCEAIYGEGVAADGSWKESSILALGLKPDAAMRLARRYRQNAIVVCDKSGMPRLVRLRVIE